MVHMEGPDEPVPPTRDCFDVARGFGRIRKCLAETCDGCVKSPVEIDHGSVGPDAANQLFPTDNFTGTLEKAGQNLKGLYLKPDAEAVLPEFSRCEIDLECAEPDNRRCR